MTSLTLKLKKDKKFVVVDMPPPEKITAKLLETWQGKPCVIEFKCQGRNVYAYGNEDVRGAWEHDKIVMDMPSFCHYWQYKILEFGIDTFTKLEMREERIFICEVEKVPPQEIVKILTDHPNLYGGDNENI